MRTSSPIATGGRSGRFCCPGDDEHRNFSSYPVSTTACCLLQAMTLAGLLASTAAVQWRVRHWSIGEYAYRRYWGLWQTCNRMYAEHGLRLRSHQCYSRFQHTSQGDTVDGRLVMNEQDSLDQLETSCLALIIFASTHSLIGLLLQVVCCLRSPCCLIVWTALGLMITGAVCIVYSIHYVTAKRQHQTLQSPLLAGRVHESMNLGWSFYSAVATTACQALLIVYMIVFCVYAKKKRHYTIINQRTHSTRSGESFL